MLLRGTVELCNANVEQTILWSLHTRFLNYLNAPKGFIDEIFGVPLKLGETSKYLLAFSYIE